MTGRQVIVTIVREGGTYEAQAHGEIRKLAEAHFGLSSHAGPVFRVKGNPPLDAEVIVFEVRRLSSRDQSVLGEVHVKNGDLDMMPDTALYAWRERNGWTRPPTTGAITPVPNRVPKKPEEATPARQRARLFAKVTGATAEHRRALLAQQRLDRGMNPGLCALTDQRVETAKKELEKAEQYLAEWDAENKT